MMKGTRVGIENEPFVPISSSLCGKNYIRVSHLLAGDIVQNGENASIAISKVHCSTKAIKMVMAVNSQSKIHNDKQ